MQKNKFYYWFFFSFLSFLFHFWSYWFSPDLSIFTFHFKFALITQRILAKVVTINYKSFFLNYHCHWSDSLCENVSKLQVTWVAGSSLYLTRLWNKMCLYQSNGCQTLLTIVHILSHYFCFIRHLLLDIKILRLNKNGIIYSFLIRLNKNRIFQEKCWNVAWVVNLVTFKCSTGRWCENEVPHCSAVMAADRPGVHYW